MNIDDTQMNEINEFHLETSKDSQPMYKYKVGKKRKNKPNTIRLIKRRKCNLNDDSSDESGDEGSEGDLEDIKDIIKMNILGDRFGRDDDKDKEKGKLNHIYFDADVTKASCRKLVSQIEELNKKIGKLNCDYDIDKTPKIYLHINSYGGSIFAAFSVIDTIRKSKVPVVTIIDGAAASAATLISVFGHERWITKHGYMLIHQLSSVCWGKMAEIEDEFDNLKEITNRILEIYTEKTKMKVPELRNVLKHDRWWRAEQCVAKGLVDKII